MAAHIVNQTINLVQGEDLEKEDQDLVQETGQEDHVHMIELDAHHLEGKGYFFKNN